MSNPTLWQQIFTKRMLACVITGFSSGLPLYILIQMVPTWLRDAKVDLATIGLISVTTAPYVWKFLWASVFDLPIFKKRNYRRRGWALVWQALLFCCVVLLSFMDPITDIWFIFGGSLILGVASASQDAVLDAHRREILPDEELGLGSSVFVNAYRLSSLIPGSLGLIIAEYTNWQTAFWTIAGCILLLMKLTTWLPEIEYTEPSTNRTLEQIFWHPLREFWERNGTKQLCLILSFMLFYKLGDSMATALASPFYLDLGFSKATIASTVKVASLWSSITGGIIGGIWMLKWGIHRSLWIFGWFQLLTILGFYWLSMDSSILPLLEQHPNMSGEEIAQSMNLAPNTWLLFWVVSAEYLGVGLGTAAFVAFISQHTSKQFSAAQFAILTSISGLPRTVATSASGWLIEQTGYPTFFVICTALAIPGMVLVILIGRSARSTSPENKDGA